MHDSIEIISFLTKVLYNQIMLGKLYFNSWESP